LESSNRAKDIFNDTRDSSVVFGSCDEPGALQWFSRGRSILGTVSESGRRQNILFMLCRRCGDIWRHYGKDKYSIHARITGTNGTYFGVSHFKEIHALMLDAIAMPKAKAKANANANANATESQPQLPCPMV